MEFFVVLFLCIAGIVAGFIFFDDWTSRDWTLTEKGFWSMIWFSPGITVLLFFLMLTSTSVDSISLTESVNEKTTTTLNEMQYTQINTDSIICTVDVKLNIKWSINNGEVHSTKLNKLCEDVTQSEIDAILIEALQ